MANAQLRHSSDTRDRILSAAELLFMQLGYASTSMRRITAKAQVNLAAVNYHFGSKEALMRAVVERRLGPLNAARIAYLEALEREAGTRPLPVERIVEAIVIPALQVSSDPLADGAVFLRLLGRAIAEPAGHMHEVLPKQHQQVILRFKQALARSLPELPAQELAWRMHFTFGAMSYTMAGGGVLDVIGTCPLDGADDAQSVIRRLIPFLTAGLQAPLADANMLRAGAASMPTGAICCRAPARLTTTHEFARGMK